MSVLNRDTDSTSSECEEEIIGKSQRGKNIKWRNLTTFDNDLDATEYMSAENLAYRGHKVGNKIENRNSTIWKSVSKCNFCMQLHSTTAFTDQLFTS